MAERATGAKRRKAKGKKQNGVGHNSGHVAHPVTDEVRQRHLDAIEKAEVAVDRARKPFQAANKRLQAAFALAREDGVHVDGMKDARKIAKTNKLEVLARYEETGRFLKLMRSPISEQLDLFRPPSWPEPVSENLKGYRVGMVGGSVDECPHVPGSELFVQWRDGHGSAQHELQQRLLDV